MAGFEPAAFPIFNRDAIIGLFSVYFYFSLKQKKEEVSKLKQVLENCIFETCAPTGVRVKNRKRGYFTSCETDSCRGGRIRTCGLPDFQSGRNNRAVLSIFLFQFKAKKKSFQKMKRLLSGWQDSNLRPPAPKAGAITGLRYTP